MCNPPLNIPPTVITVWQKGHGFQNQVDWEVHSYHMSYLILVVSVFSWKMEITSPPRGDVILCDRVKFSVQCLAHNRSLYAQFPSFTEVPSCPLHTANIFHRCHQNILCSNGVDLLWKILEIQDILLPKHCTSSPSLFWQALKQPVLTIWILSLPLVGPLLCITMS